jgi:hypothetical protein
MRYRLVDLLGHTRIETTLDIDIDDALELMELTEIYKEAALLRSGLRSFQQLCAFTSDVESAPARA